MTVIDANLLLYAYDSESRFHSAAREWIERTFSSGVLVGLPWQSIYAFVRIVTNPQLRGRRFSIEEAVKTVQSWIDQPNVRVLGPGDGHWTFLSSTLIEGQAKGPLSTDAALAALTIEYGGTLHTTDRDFSRFANLRWKNPLK